MDTSDVDMVDDAGHDIVGAGSLTDRTPTPSFSRPPSSRSASSTPEPYVAADIEADSASDSDSDSDDDDGAPAAEEAGAAEEENLVGADPGPGPEDAEPSSTAPPPKRKRRQRSPSPIPLPPTPLTTIRLEIKIEIGSEDYQYDILDLAKATGQRPSSPKAIKADSSDTEDGEGDDEADHQNGAAPAKPKRRRRKSDWYDVEDAFIDDTDLAVDARTTFAETKQKGFYVSSGDVQLVRDRTPVKTPKHKLALFEISQAVSSSGSAFRPRIDQNKAGSSRSKGEGTKDAPIALLSDGEDKKRKAQDAVGGRTKKRRTELRAFSSELQANIDELKLDIDKENWDNKSKFPAGIKPRLKAVAVKAIETNEYDDNFFNLLPSIFPYNRFTMTKLVKRLVCADHVRILGERQDNLIVDLSRLAHDSFEQAKTDHQRALEQWERRQEKRAEGLVVAVPSTGTDSPPISAAFPSALEDPDAPPPSTQMIVDGEAGKGRDTKAPEPRYKLNDPMKKLIWELVCISNECVRLENEKNELEGNKGKDLSEQGYRKSLYQKIVHAFPDGWMTSGQISREVSILKKRAEREALEIQGLVSV